MNRCMNASCAGLRRSRESVVAEVVSPPMRPIARARSGERLPAKTMALSFRGSQVTSLLEQIKGQ